MGSEIEFKKFVKKHGNKNIGIKHKRIAFECFSSSRERSFAKNWRKECKPNSILDYGHGILQDLFCDGTNSDLILCEHEFLHEITPEEKVVTATVIQWLGTNNGFAFLEKCLNDCGYELNYKNK